MFPWRRRSTGPGNGPLPAARRPVCRGKGRLLGTLGPDPHEDARGRCARSPMDACNDLG